MFWLQISGKKDVPVMISCTSPLLFFLLFENIEGGNEAFLFKYHILVNDLVFFLFFGKSFVDFGERMRKMISLVNRI